LPQTSSAPIAVSRFQIYLLRTSTLLPRGGGYALGWKQSPRGAVDGARPEDSTPTFAEMAVPGTTFDGDWNEKAFFLEPEVRRSIRWPEGFNRAKIFEAVNVYAAGLLALQRQYASWADLGLLDRSLDELEQWLGGARQRGSCLLSPGIGRRSPRQELLAGCHQPGLPPDPRAIRVLQPRPGFEPALPQDPPHRFPEQQARHAFRVGQRNGQRNGSIMVRPSTTCPWVKSSV